MLPGIVEQARSAALFGRVRAIAASEECPDRVPGEMIHWMKGRLKEASVSTLSALLGLGDKEARRLINRLLAQGAVREGGKTARSMGGLERGYQWA